MCLLLFNNKCSRYLLSVHLLQYISIQTERERDRENINKRIKERDTMGKYCWVVCVLVALVLVNNNNNNNCPRVSATMPSPLEILGVHKFYYFESQLTNSRLDSLRRTNINGPNYNKRVYQVREWISWENKFYLTIEREKNVDGIVGLINYDYHVSFIDGHSQTFYWIRNNDKKCLVDKLNKREPYYLGLNTNKHKTNEVIDKLATEHVGIKRRDLFTISGVEAIWLNGLARGVELKPDEASTTTTTTTNERVWSYETLTKIVATTTTTNSPQQEEISNRRSPVYGEDNQVRVELAFSFKTQNDNNLDKSQPKLNRIDVISDRVNSSYKLLAYGGYDQLSTEAQPFMDTFVIDNPTKVNINNWLKLCHAPMSTMVYPKLSHQMFQAGSYHLRYYFVILETRLEAVNGAEVTNSDDQAKQMVKTKSNTLMKEKLFVDEYWSSKQNAQLFVVESHSKSAPSNENGPQIWLFYRDLAARKDYLVIQQLVSPTSKCYNFVSRGDHQANESKPTNSMWSFDMEMTARQKGLLGDFKLDIVSGQLKGLGAMWLNSENHAKESKVREENDKDNSGTEWLLKVSSVEELKFVFNGEFNGIIVVLMFTCLKLNVSLLII